MNTALKVGELVQHYAKKYDVTVVAQVIELPDGHSQVKIRVLRSPLPELEGREWYISESWLLKADGHPRHFVGGGYSWVDSLEEIRDRVLGALPAQLQPDAYTENPTMELYFSYHPEWVSYHIWMHPRDLELKLTLGIKDEDQRERAYELLYDRKSEIKADLKDAQFNWSRTLPRTVFQDISWPGEEGPRPVDIDETAKTLELYIKTLQRILGDL
jgi:hypothetical protein